MNKVSEMNLVDVDKLIPYVNNARTHSKEQINKLRASIREFGFINPVIIDRDYNVIAGHGRILASQEEGIDKVPCVFVDYLTDAQKKAYIIADNRMALDADWDEELLKIEIESLKDEDFDIVTTDEEEQGDIRDKQDYARFNGNKLVRAIGFYNPNAKYDYYEEQTYLSGNSEENDIVFKKEYEHIRDTDTIKLKYLDFPAMLEKEKERRRKAYRKYVEILGHEPNFKTWDMFEKECGEDFSKKEGNRQLYWNQPDVKAYAENICRWGNPDEFMCTEQEYVDKTAYPISQIVTDDEWIAQYEVGWFAVTYNETPAKEYNKRVDEALAKIDPETNVYIMDCHI